MSPDADTPPPPPSSVPAPPGGVWGAPVYRQDVVVRAPGPWTRKLQTAIAALFTVNGVLSPILLFVFFSEARRLAEQQTAKQLQQQGQSVDPARLKQLVDIGMGFAVGFVIIFAAVALLLAAGSYFRRWTWLWWTDLVLLSIGTVTGGISLVLAIAGVSQTIATEQAFNAIAWVAGTAILAWVIVAAVRYGPWGQPMVPAQLET